MTADDGGGVLASKAGGVKRISRPISLRASSSYSLFRSSCCTSTKFMLRPGTASTYDVNVVVDKISLPSM